jgi:transcription-repair coupling factor (superfamily II helicase)
VSGIEGSGKAHYLFSRIYEIRAAGGGCGKEISDLRVFAFVKDEELNSFCGDLRSFFGSAACDWMRSTEILALPSDDIEQKALTTTKIKNLKSFVVCATDISINSSVLSPCSEQCIDIVQNQKYNFSGLERSLIDFGYTRTNFVEDRLQFAVRGGLIDVWPAVAEAPVRIVFEFDRVEVIRIFDPENQLSNAFVSCIKILSVNFLGHNSTIKDYFEKCSVDSGAAPRVAGVSEQVYDLASCWSSDKFKSDTVLFFDYPIDAREKKSFDSCGLIINDSLNICSKYQGYKSFAGFQGNKTFFASMLKSFAEKDVAIKIYCANESERERVADIFYEARWDCKNSEFLYGDLSRGFYLESARLACVSSREMLYKKSPQSFPKIKYGRRLEGIWEISAGDYVVHEKYGIGRYAGLKTISRENSVSEYLCIEYKNGDKLYVPPDGMKTVKKYIGIEGVRPKLYSMDNFAWERVKSAAREAAAKFAKELLKLYTQRSLTERKPFSAETTWEKELADTFPYEETPDQLKAIEDVKRDFSKPYPMERLVCGDVGYGKTEIAVRAAFKVVQDGVQAAVLVPTTILAQQHYGTFCSRLSAFPTNIAVLSRFQNKANQKEIVQNLEKGLIDIVIGTHRLLQKDVKFKNLGLLVIDEEHRFGVKQKEKIKSMKKNIDILILSATPIPRTLSSALSGFRDLSVIETPPFGRLPIETNLSLYDEKLIKNIIEAELSRNGQVFYVYNKVETILTKAADIKRLVPEARLGIVHGQMKTKDIEDVMWKFTNMELDVLLATAIIESGLDIPSVNTIVIEEAENFGLSQLYQMRGRIGREKRKAYCYLFYKDEALSGEAVKRLEAMREFGELGSGFRLALRDLEIRGAGGILSANQHGFVRDVGYDMFARLLEEEGRKVKGSMPEIQEKENTVIDLQVKAFIPGTYIRDEDTRILFYRKLSEACDAEAIEKLKDELHDRFGRIPDETRILFEIAGIRFAAGKLGVERITENDSHICLYFSQETDFSEAGIAKLAEDYSGVIEFIAGRYCAFKLKKDAASTVEYLKKFLSYLGFCILKRGRIF